MKNNIIEIKNLSKDYEIYKKEIGLWSSFKNLFLRKYIIKKAVKNVSFEIEDGEFVGFLGPNGAGKTTVLKILSGIIYPTNGNVTVMGFTPQERKKKFLKNIGIVMGQKNQLYWDIPPVDSFNLFKNIYEINDKTYKQRLDELAETLDVKDILNTPLRKLSLGQRMKCELIAALIHKPKVLFLDEPTIGLDVVAKKNMWDFLKKYNQKEKTTIILTSHYIEDIKKLCNKVMIIDKGMIIYKGTLDDITQKYIHNRQMIIRLEKEVDIKKIEKYGDVYENHGLQYEISIPKNKAAQIVAQVLKELPVADISINPPDADEVIREIFTKGIK